VHNVGSTVLIIGDTFNFTLRSSQIGSRNETEVWILARQWLWQYDKLYFNKTHIYEIPINSSRRNLKYFLVIDNKRLRLSSGIRKTNCHCSCMHAEWNTTSVSLFQQPWELQEMCFEHKMWRLSAGRLFNPVNIERFTSQMHAATRVPLHVTTHVRYFYPN
jgi:hypothetical protein